MYELIPLTPNGQTGNTTSAGVPISGYDALAFEFVVEAAGATPTITWKIQASPSDPSIADANSNWYDLGYITDASDTISTTTKTATAVGASIIFLSNPVARQYRKFRVVPSANTNITYHVNAYRAA